MQSGVFQRSQRFAIGQNNWPIEKLIPRHDANSGKRRAEILIVQVKAKDDR
jgi:hypothetical protein